MDQPSETQVDCPTGGEAVALSLPRSAAALTVVATRRDDLDDAVRTDGRTRLLSYSRPADHAVHVYFEW